MAYLKFSKSSTHCKKNIFWYVKPMFENRPDIRYFNDILSGAHFYGSLMSSSKQIEHTCHGRVCHFLNTKRWCRADCDAWEADFGIVLCLYIGYDYNNLCSFCWPRIWDRKYHTYTHMIIYYLMLLKWLGDTSACITACTLRKSRCPEQHSV